MRFAQIFVSWYRQTTELMYGGAEGASTVEKNVLNVYITQEGDVNVIVGVGPVDSATFEAFRQKMDPVCSKAGVRILLDCKELTYLNSRAIGLLVKYQRTVVVARGRFALCNLNPKLVRTLDLLQLGKALVIHPTREAALEDIRKTD